MAGNGTFQQKNISLLKQKGFESLGSGFIFLKKKKLFWAWPMETLFSHKLGQKIVNFRGFSKNCLIIVFIIIEFPNMLH